MVIKVKHNGNWVKVNSVKVKESDGFKSISSQAFKEVPSIFEKSVLVDCGRKYWSINSMKSLIDRMQTLGFNTLLLHFSEDMGMRIESKMYPWLAGSDASLCVVTGITDADEGSFWTQEEVVGLCEYSKSKGIKIVPSFDTPGHMNYLVKKYNEHYGTDIGNYYHYNGQTKIVPGSGNTSYSRGIDISNSEARTFALNLIEEYAKLFNVCGCRRFDIGGDELLGYGARISSSVSRWQQLDHWKDYAIAKTGNSNAVAYDAFLLWMNDIYDLLISLGYTTVRMWNDDALRSHDTGWSGVVNLNTNIGIQYWTSGQNAVTIYTNAGHNVYNYLETYNYYVLKDGYTQPTASGITSSYSPTIFGTMSYTGDQLRGDAFCIWCDNPSYQTASEVLASVDDLLVAHASKWIVEADEPESPTDYPWLTDASYGITNQWEIYQYTEDSNTLYAIACNGELGESYNSAGNRVWIQTAGAKVYSWISSDNGKTWIFITEYLYATTVKSNSIWGSTGLYSKTTLIKSGKS